MGPSRLLDQLHDELNGLRTEQRKLFSIGFSSACSQSYPAWQVRLDRDDGTFQSDDSGGESLGMHRNPLHLKWETQQTAEGKFSPGTGLLQYGTQPPAFAGARLT